MGEEAGRRCFRAGRVSRQAFPGWMGRQGAGDGTRIWQLCQNPDPVPRWHRRPLATLFCLDLCHLIRWLGSEYTHWGQCSMTWGKGNVFLLPQIVPLLAPHLRWMQRRPPGLSTPEQVRIALLICWWWKGGLLEECASCFRPQNI